MLKPGDNDPPLFFCTSGFLGDVMGFFKNFCMKDDGVTSIEYALIAALIFLVILSSITILSNKMQTHYEDINSAIS